MSEITEYTTWEFLATFAGAVIATATITQFTKGIADKHIKIPTQFWSYMIAVIVMIAALFFTNSLTLSSGVLCVVNAIFVTLAANGGYDTLKRMKSK